MSNRQLILVAAGGATGAFARWAISTIGTEATFPWPTLLVNVAGCAVLGWVLASKLKPQGKALLGTGFCGGLTTFSTMSVEIASLLRAENMLVSWSYLVSSVILGLVAYGLGRLAADGSQRTIV